MESKVEKLKSYREYILSKADHDEDAETISDMIDIMIIHFGTWYSGMDVRIVENALNRYKNEVLNENNNGK